MTSIADLISESDIKYWKDGDTITIKAPCGKGKSYFIKNTLYDYCKTNGYKILFLIHRNNCKDQFQNELIKDNKTDVIDIVSYQKIESNLKRGKDFSFKDYKYIVCDEFHYFVSDSFNKYTDLSYNHIIDSVNQIKIFMSATGEFMSRYINGQSNVETINYEIEPDYSFIKKLEFYYSDDVLENYIEDAYINKRKTIFFLSLTNALKYHKKYKHCSLFNCSESKSEYKNVNKEQLQSVLKNEKFEQLFLFTTTVMDAGLNIIDDELENIVIDVGIDLDVIIQCIGRKRLTSTSNKINVLMKAYSNKRLGGFETKLKDSIKHAEYLGQHGLSKYMKEYYREHDPYQIVYDDENNFGGTYKKINYLRYWKVIYSLSIISTIKSYSKYNNYCTYVSDKLGLSYSIKDTEETDKGLEEYLKYLSDNEVRLVTSITEKLSDKFRYELKSKLVDAINLNVNGKQMKTVKTLNAGLDMLDMKYYISPCRLKNLKYWTVVSMENDEE